MQDDKKSELSSEEHVSDSRKKITADLRHFASIFKKSKSQVKVLAMPSETVTVSTMSKIRRLKRLKVCAKILNMLTFINNMKI